MINSRFNFIRSASYQGITRPPFGLILVIIVFGSVTDVSGIPIALSYNDLLMRGLPIDDNKFYII